MKKDTLIPLILLAAAVLLVSCRAAPAVQTSTPAPSASPTITEVTLPASTLTSTTAPTDTPAPPTLTPTSAASVDLLACPEIPPASESEQTVELLYTNQDQVWSWEAASGTKTLLSLPEEAVAPQISPDGQTIAYLLQDQAFDTPEYPVESIPLWLFDIQSSQKIPAGSYSTVETRRDYPESPNIYLRFAWLPGSQHLLVQVYPYPLDVGILQPAGPLYLVDVRTGSSRLLLEAGSYELYSLHPDGSQVAALDTQAISANGEWAYELHQEGSLHLLDVAAGGEDRSLPVRLPQDPWAFMPPVYSPDGMRVAFNSEYGLTVVDTGSGELQEIPLENTCRAENDCQWTDYLPVYWLPDGKSFYTTQTINDLFDERAVTTLSQVFLEPEARVEVLATIHANPHTFVFSPDRRILSYWNQPDFDRLEKTKEGMNWITLYLMDLDQGKTILYTEAYLLRIIDWNPDNQLFLYTFSRIGGANPVRNQLGLGSICQPARLFQVPEEALIDRVEWLDASRFLAWTIPDDGLPGRYQKGLFLYDQAEQNPPLQIDSLLQVYFDPYSGGNPYGENDQVVLVSK